jgi:hypothetical protein
MILHSLKGSICGAILVAKVWRKLYSTNGRTPDRFKALRCCFFKWHARYDRSWLVRARPTLLVVALELPNGNEAVHKPSVLAEPVLRRQGSCKTVPAGGFRARS